MQNIGTFKRIFYLEPFLIKAERHFIEATLAVDQYLSKQDAIYHIIGNKNLNMDVKRLLPIAVPAISQTCFESMEDGGESFFNDILSLDKKYKFSSDDLLIIPTSYENQILGIAKYLGSVKYFNKLPKIAMQFHQLFPPAVESDDIDKIKFRRFWIKRLRDAFKKINSNSVSYWTTESKRLNSDFRKISNKYVGKLSFPYMNPGKVDNSFLPVKTLNSSKKTKVAFLGEGRQEKGLIYFLKAIEYINKKKNNFIFVIQNMNPRGYSEEQKKDFNDTLNKVSKHNNVIMINDGISPLPFSSLLQSVHGIILPYNPVNYHRRISGLLIHAAVYGKPAIVSSGTWSSSILKKKQAGGIIFNYLRNNKKKTLLNLIEKIYLFDSQKEILLEEAEKLSYKFKKYSTAEKYLKKILSYYEEKT